jgi:hypothetical protein
MDRVRAKLTESLAIPRSDSDLPALPRTSHHAYCSSFLARRRRRGMKVACSRLLQQSTEPSLSREPSQQLFRPALTRATVDSMLSEKRSSAQAVEYDNTIFIPDHWTPVSSEG